MTTRPGFRETRVCPKTGQPVGRRWPWWLAWVYPLVGLFALLWVVVRVGMKPARAAYPCQRVAMPLASGFVIWILGLTGCVVAFRQARKRLRQSRYALAALFAAAALLAIGIGLDQSAPPTAAAPWNPSDPPNAPVGTARGIYPGRVVWTHDPAATSWDGASNYWWQSQFTDQAAVERMLSQAVRALAGEPTEASAWNAIFRHFNRTRRNQDVPYAAGEKIAVKVNMNTTSNYSPDIRQTVSPQVLKSLLRQLVNVVGAAQADITVYDAARAISAALYDPPEGCSKDFPQVRYVDKKGTDGRTLVAADTTVPFHFADLGITYTTRLPTCATGATYLINLSLLRGHDLCGVTLSAKNHFGSVWSDSGKGWSPNYLHNFATRTRPMGSYNALVDLEGHKDLGGKTVLYLMDGLYGAPSQGSQPIRWTSRPFGTDWTSSLLVSQDGVAIDSVALDFCRDEPQLENNVKDNPDNYLHEAAQANNPPSGTFYAPNGDGVRLGSLGVHEHWNNATERKYYRNLHPAEDKGIELVALTWAPLVLRNGYNLIALPVAPWGTPFTAESLAQHITTNAVPPVTCTSVIRYEGGSFATHPVGTAVDNFPIEVGKGYFVRCSFGGTESAWTAVGRPLCDLTATIGLAGGYTLVGLPRDPASPYTAEDAGIEINAQKNGSATQVVRYDAELGQFVTHPIGTAVANFTLKRGEGYFIRCAGTSTWTLSRQ